MQGRWCPSGRSRSGFAADAQGSLSRLRATTLTGVGRALLAAADDGRDRRRLDGAFRDGYRGWRAGAVSAAGTDHDRRDRRPAATGSTYGPQEVSGAPPAADGPEPREQKRNAAKTRPGRPPSADRHVEQVGKP